MREPRHPATRELHLTHVLHALSDPVRLSIVLDLAEQGETACAAFAIPLAKATRSHHFRVLRDAGVIRTRTEGRSQYAALRDDDLDERFPGLLTAILAEGEDRKQHLPRTR